MTVTLGEYRVGISFNPSSNPQVDAIKRVAADFIDIATDSQVAADDSRWERQSEIFRECIDHIDKNGIPERARLVGLAHGCLKNVSSRYAPREMVVNEIENAAMWAVKAATKGPHE